MKSERLGLFSATSHPTWPGLSSVAYPGTVTDTDEDREFAEAAGRRIQQAFALCSFASQLVGKARQ